ncbi:MAG: ASCH domain-containing protein, partial [Deltaproteobacteria bacterium]|nr:ASCH domain-containing protein [Deltaproteobacteria bacterium]
ALSIRQPWAWLILNAGKDIENRDWRTNFRGRVLIHASKSCARSEYENAVDFMVDRGIDRLDADLPSIDQFERGGIIGSVEIVDCTDTSDSPWFVGAFGFVLRNPKPLPFVPWKGQLGFFNVQGVQP